MPQHRINGIDLHYEVSGAGEPLLFIHGLGSCWQDWEAQIAEFSQRYRVIAFDLRGHGQSGKPAGPYSMQMLAVDAAGLLRELETGPAHVVGVSLGGGVAFQLAVSFPGLVKSLVIVNSNAEAVIGGLRQRLQIWNRFVLIALLKMSTIARLMSEKLLPGPHLDQVRAGFVERFGHNDKPGYLACLRAFLGWSVMAEVGSIACPTLMIAADQDYTPVAVKAACVARMPNAELVVIADARHALPMEKPREFNAALQKFLAQHA
jgi:pimeloyl-ACP methyl ester carboxylesterase